MTSKARKVRVASAGRPYSAAVQAGNLVWFSGVTPPRPVIQESDAMVVQAEACLARLQGVVEEAGLTLDDVVRTTVYLVDAADFDAMNEVYRHFFPEEPPARTTVVSGLCVPGARIEVDAVAVVPREG
ncbi:RidA family protein [Limnochorda pilosa]|uniref:Endoribonuclease L-PSP n=1 Tax=Limnochorda pilosa TaxID=1555112 RepID=A0A0K2SLT4_LIMPI|nr:RidA family protein [Limnochorda pilosa]BAS28065.1 endoribonuclease L-PSP [Limnochorda pilosa]